MAHSFTTAAGSGELDDPLRRDIDSHMDNSELLPFRYQKVLAKS
jgi:hypothetical protein